MASVANPVANPTAILEISEVQAAAGKLGLDVATLEIRDRIKLDHAFRPWQFTPDGKGIYAQLSNEHAVISYDLAARKVVKRLDLRVKPGTDAWLLSAMIAVLVQENLIARDWLAAHADGLDDVLPHFASLDVAAYCATCGVEEELVRTTTRRIAAAATSPFP